jgi:uncharacterized membrane protein
MTDQPETAATTSRRGRPRPQSTIDRDQQVLNELTGDGKTREDLVTATNLTKTQVYLSLYRLRAQELVERSRDGGKHVWKQTTPAA